MTAHKIGSTYGGITDLKSLTPPVPYPYQSFKPYSKVIGTGAGGAVGIGWATDEWAWTFLTATQRNVLRALCPTASAEVYIQTYNDGLASPAWKIYRCKMIWQEDGEDRQASRRLKLRIIFRCIEDVTP